MALQEFKITWYCRRVGLGEQIDRTVAYDQQPLVSPLYHRLKDLPMILAQGRKFDSKEYLAKENAHDEVFFFLSISVC